MVGVRSRLFVLLGLVAVAVAVTSSGSRAEPAQQPSTTQHEPAGKRSQSVVIDASVNETFTPVSTYSAARQVLSPARAYSKSVGGPTPSGSRRQLGYLTLPVGVGAPGQYLAKDQLVYAFTSATCGPVMLPAPLPGSTPPTNPEPTNCVHWYFVDARTGAMVDETWSHD